MAYQVMDTTLIHNKIKEFEGMRIKPSPVTVINYFKNRLIEIECHISASEMDHAELSYRIQKDSVLIDMLCKLLIITGNGEKLRLDFDDQNIQRAIDLLAENKDRINHGKIRSIASLIAISDFESEFSKIITELELC